MAYEVIKTIKGKKYLYRQESFRICGKVCTRSTYLGAIDSKTGELRETSKKPKVKKQSHHSKVNPTKSRKRPRKGSGQEDHVFKLAGMFISGKLRKYYISTDGVRNRYNALQKRLWKKGVDMSLCPKLVLTDSGEPKIKSVFKAEKNEVVLHFPKEGGNSSEYRREVAKMFARNALEQIRKQQPENYRKLSLQFDESFKQTNRCLANYVKLGNDRGKEAKVIALHVWGHMQQMEKNVLDPERVGICDLSRRKGWRDEVASIYAALERQGKGSYIEERKKQYAMANSELHRARTNYYNMNRLNPRRKPARRRWQRAELRIQAQREMMKKVRLVGSIFF